MPDDHDDLIETLAEFIQRRKQELGLSNRDIWRKGGVDYWSHQAVNNLVDGSTRNPGEQTIERLAIALETSTNNIRKRSGRRRHGKPFQLPPRAAALSDRERRVMVDLLDAVLGKFREEDEPVPVPRRAGRRLQAVDAEPENLAQPPAPDMERVAARRGRSTGKDARRSQDEDAEDPS